MDVKLVVINHVILLNRIVTMNVNFFISEKVKYLLGYSRWEYRLIQDV